MIDFNIHLPPAPSLADELDMGRLDLPARIRAVAAEAQQVGATRGNLMILDTGFLRRDAARALDAVDRTRFKVTVMVDPREADAVDLVRKHASRIDGIKFHPYLLNLHDAAFADAALVAAAAEEFGLWIAVDCSYGTLNLYEVSGPRLVATLARSIRTPIIALHGGGRRVLDVMVIAQAATNVYLDTSFSIPFWLGSSVEMDFAFAIRTLGVRRCLYGSDSPYVSMAEACQATRTFLNRHGFDQADIESLMSGTAARLFDKDGA